MIRPFFATLQALPVVSPADPSRLEAAAARAFHLILDFVRDEQNVAHPALHAMTTLCWHWLTRQQIFVYLDTSKGRLPSLSFYGVLSPGPQASQMGAGYLLPYGYLDLIREDPLMQCCAVVHMASRGCDYATYHLAPVLTELRARAYEAEFLLLWRPLMQREGLPWKLNRYLEGVLSTYPAGLSSLPQVLHYTPPTSP